MNKRKTLFLKRCFNKSSWGGLILSLVLLSNVSIGFCTYIILDEDSKSIDAEAFVDDATKIFTFTSESSTNYGVSAFGFYDTNKEKLANSCSYSWDFVFLLIMPLITVF